MSSRIFCASWLVLLLAGCTSTINVNSGTPSDPNGTPITCGDGILDQGEQCDDGNQDDTDACKNNCQPPQCGDSIVSITEGCDDGNTINNDSCKNDCTLPLCGDGVLSSGEQCDDGNTTNGDGCNAACNIEDLNTALLITSPGEGDSFERAGLNSTFEFVTDPISFTSLANDSNITTVEYTTETGFSLGSGSAPDFVVTSPFKIDGNRTITAHGRNAAGVEIATAVVHIVITPPVDENCLARITQLGVNFTQDPPTLGINTPIRFLSPLAGITYIPSGSTGPRANGELASCLLAETLAHAGPVLAAKGITSIVHLGIYNFRCIGGGNPVTDGCNVSQHAFANAIDLHEFRTATGQAFNVETDFVIDTAGNTCAAATSNPADALLHEIACALLNPTTLFHIVLTPNFNSDHRNHFHVDITPGSNFIRSLRPDGSVSTEPLSVDPVSDQPLGD